MASEQQSTNNNYYSWFQPSDGSQHIFSTYNGYTNSAVQSIKNHVTDLSRNSGDIINLTTDHNAWPSISPSVTCSDLSTINKDALELTVTSETITHEESNHLDSSVQSQLIFCQTSLEDNVSIALDTSIPTPAAVGTKYDQQQNNLNINSNWVKDNSNALYNINNTKRQRKVTKQVVGEENWKRNQRKLLRNSGKAYTNTSGKLVCEKKFMEYDCNCPLKCATNLSLDKREKIFNSFWSLGEWAKQTSFIHSNIEVIEKKRAYKKIGSRRKYTRIFKLCNVRICKKMFTQTLSISDSRLHRAIAHKRPGVFRLPKSDLRGRHKPHNKLPDRIVESIREHIRQLPKSTVREVRQQLQANSKKVPNTSEMTVSRLFEDYKRLCTETEQIAAKQWMYRHTFHMVVDPRHINKCGRCQVEQKRRLREQEKQCAQLPELANLMQATTVLLRNDEQPLDLTNDRPSADDNFQMTNISSNISTSQNYTIQTTMVTTSSSTSTVTLSDNIESYDLLGNNEDEVKNVIKQQQDKDKIEFIKTIFQDKKNKRKLLRNIGASYVNSAGRLIAGKQFNEHFTCCCPIKCSTKLDNDDRRRIFEEYWQLGDWDKQTAFLHESIEVTNIKRKQKRVDSRRKHTRVFRLCGIKVCKTMFINTLGITSARVNRAVDHKIPGLDAQPKRDQRGQHAPHNKTPESTLQNIRQHIQSIGPSNGMDTSHMYKLYIAECQNKNKTPAKLWMYRQILNSEFRLERQSYLDSQRDGRRKQLQTDQNNKLIINSNNDVQLILDQQRYDDTNGQQQQYNYFLLCTTNNQPLDLVTQPDLIQNLSLQQ